VSTSDTTNTQAGQSLAPQQQRSRRNNPYSWMTFDFCITIIQIISLVVVLSVFPDEHPHMALVVWTIGYGAGCLAALPLFYYNYNHLREQSNRLLEAYSIASPGFEGDEFETGRHERYVQLN